MSEQEAHRQNEIDFTAAAEDRARRRYDLLFALKILRAKTALRHFCLWIFAKCEIADNHQIDFESLCRRGPFQEGVYDEHSWETLICSARDKGLLTVAQHRDAAKTRKRLTMIHRPARVLFEGRLHGPVARSTASTATLSQVPFFKKVEVLQQ